MKKVCTILCIISILSLGVFAKSVWELGLGLTEIEDTYYGSFSFRPDIKVGKLGLGLSLTLHFNAQGLRLEDWQDNGNFSITKSLARVVRYVSWAELGDPVYFRLGELSNVYVANGLIMDGYRNLSAYEIRSDIRKLGVDLAGDAGILGAHVMVNDALKPELFVLHPYVRPLYFVDGIPGFLKNTSVGVVYARDTRPAYKMPYAYGLDLTMPLLRNFIFYFHTAELANNSRGHAVGARSNLGPLYLRGEYRVYGEHFRPAVYDWQYEDYGTAMVLQSPKANGYMAEAGFSLLQDNLYFNIRYDNMMIEGQDSVPTLTGRAVIGSDLFAAVTGRKGQLEASYSQLNFVKIGDFTNQRTKIDAAVSLELYRGLMGRYVYTVTFTENSTPVRFQAFEVVLGGGF